MRLTKAQKAAITALEDIKARDITTLDTRKLTAMYDALIIATADSARQTKALARNVHDKVKAAGGTVLSTEGEDAGEWVLVDCADFVVHIMQPQARALYNLEELWTPPAPRKRTGAAKVAPASDGAATPETAASPAAARSRATKTARPVNEAPAAVKATKAGKAAKTSKAAQTSSAAKPPQATKTPKAAAKAPARKRVPTAPAPAPAAPATPKASARSTPAAPRARRRVVE